MSFFKTALFVLILVCIDQTFKFWVASNLILGESYILLPILNLTLVHNYGIAFSLFYDVTLSNRWILVTLVSFIVFYLAFLISKLEKKDSLEYFSLTLIISGGLGNLIDRSLLGYVIDFIHVHYLDYSFYIFNFADIFITIGVLFYIVHFLSEKSNL